MGRRLEDWLKSYLEYTESSEAPSIFHFWTGVSTIAGALRRRVWIDMRQFEWIPNFYIIFVAPPGVATKSTTINVGKSLLKEVEGINFGPDSGTWQAIGQSLMDAQEFVPLIPGDLEGSMEEMSCITCPIGELGTFLDFKDGKLIDTLTGLWDGQRGTFEHKTKTTGSILIANPWINIIGGTTPSWLRKNVPEESIGGGFASRVIFIYAEKKRRLVPYPSLVGEHKRYLELREDLIHDLRMIASMLGEMYLSPEAVEWGIEWYKKLWTERDVDLASARYDGYISRKQTHVHKLAMVISAAESQSQIIELSHLQKAVKLVTETEKDMIKVFESIGVAPTSQNMHEILSFLDTYRKQGQAASQQTVMRYALQIMSQQDLSEAVDSCIKAGYLELRQDASGVVYYNLIVDLNEIGKDANANANNQTKGVA